MEQARYRKHPRVYDKRNPNAGEKDFTISVAAAAGILAVIFFKGLFCGYMLRKHMD